MQPLFLKKIRANFPAFEAEVAVAGKTGDCRHRDTVRRASTAKGLLGFALGQRLGGLAEYVAPACGSADIGVAKP